ncbi:tetratricopeptide repeat protein [Sphingomonas cannabina]|uniref:tetratricopeptide repeat protein n=1 Tax=Sphingomonas cannabina TaxID=2899123 RepID=UPI001F1D3EDD|nr:tetratricopeptide repeat protein [Sphingomonas cannabina]UIJ44700.1 tetratricopeptide repeat protein [Sphingomonas cannabina]
MALSPQSNEAFFREVDDELRRDQAVALWRRWGIAIVAVVVLALAAFGGWLYWQSHREAKAGEQSITFNKALDELGNRRTEAARPMLEQLAKEGTPGYAALSKFTLADLALQKNDLKAAAARFAEVANDGSAAEPLRNLALIRQTLAEYDSLQPQVVIDRLRPFAVKGNPYFASAAEMTAVAYLRTGRKDLAGRLFGDIAKDETVPASVRQRAVQMAGVLGVDAVAQPEEKKAQ